MSDCESTCHPFERGVVMAEGVDSGGPVKDVEVVVSEGRVVVELGFEEVEEVGGSEWLCEVGVEEVEEVVVVVVVVVGESESGEWSERSWWWWWWLWKRGIRDWREWWCGCGGLKSFPGIEFQELVFQTHFAAIPWNFLTTFMFFIVTTIIYCRV